MLKTEDGTELKASDLTADGKHILMFLEEEKEPTEHILNEMMGAGRGFRRICRADYFCSEKQRSTGDTDTVQSTCKVKKYSDLL